MNLEIPGLRSKRPTPHGGKLEVSQAVAWGDLEGHTMDYSDGSERQGSAAEADVLVGAFRQARLRFVASSATA